MSNSMRRSMLAASAVATLSVVAAGAAAGDAGPPALSTNQAYVMEATRATDLAIDDPMAVFGFVFGSLPERVTVYPTENHYYFSILHNGVRYAGNIKIDARSRDSGKVPFVYYADQPAWLGDTLDQEVMLDASRGVTVDKIAPLAYQLTYKDKSVVFALNDLSKVRPPQTAVAPDEQFIGPVFDESGVRFFLMFNAKLQLFLYLLDETVTPADAFVPAGGDGRIVIGKRTGFAFYRDGRRDRKILIGVHADNVLANNYFDGPFDQMPDNFIDGDSFRNALLAIAPSLKGEIDRFGSYADGARYVVSPYMQYRAPADLAIFPRCATSQRNPTASYYQCFVLPPDQENGPGARPVAMRRNGRHAK
jgi:hypothetical protein